ncbi:MAG: hypothetical protein KDA70_20935 [Planctomycetaceae bacterium]|nr:hypothetical protein [Planctomycetaceae bacterium]
MKEYYFREQRTQYQKCPGCQAEIELDADQCRFCDCKMASVEQESEPESLTLSRPETNESASSIAVMMLLNIVVSLAGVFVTSADRYPDKPAHDHEFRLTEQESDYSASLFQKKHTQPEDRFHARADRNAVTETTYSNRHKPQRF